MDALLYTILGAVTLSGYYLYRIAPNNPQKQNLKPFEEFYIAHRGLFDNNTNAPENSLEAFRLALMYNFGIELDVQITTDKKLVVFHDNTLERMCGVKRKVTECNYDELKKYKLANSDENIPLLDDVLEIVAGKVPLVIEIKSTEKLVETVQLMAERMDSYAGIYCVESFHPLAIEWYRKNRPNIIRGQLSDDFFKSKENLDFFKKFVLSNLLMNNHSRPDFIAYNFKNKNQISYRICRFLFKVKNFAWTVRSESDLNDAKKSFDILIFDSFIPKKTENVNAMLIEQNLNLQERNRKDDNNE